MAATIGTTFQSLIQRVAQRADVYDSFTASNGGTTTSIIATALWKPNNNYQGMWAYVSATNSSLAPYNEERQVSASTQSATSLTLSYALSSAIQSGSTFELYNRWSHTAIGRAVNEGIRNSGGYWWQVVLDETTTTNASTFSYSLASLSVPVEERYGLLRVSYRENTTFASYPYYAIKEWEIHWNGTSPTLQFGRKLYPQNRALRLEYIASPAALSAPTDKTGVVDPYFDSFVVEWALSALEAGRLTRAPAQEKDIVQASYRLHRDEAERTRATKAPRRKPMQIWRSGSRADDESSRWLAAYAGLLS